MRKSYGHKFTVAVIAAATTAAFVAEVPTQAATNPFTDVKAGSANYNAIVSLAESGVITGVTLTTFQPNAYVTRGDAAIFIANALGLDTTNVTNPNFTDISTTSKYYGAVSVLSGLGIINGFADGTFKPTNTLTRVQMSKMLTLAFGFQLAKSSVTKFTDVNKIRDVNTKLYIQTLVNYRITTGTTATTFSPSAKLTRGQLAVFLYRAMQVPSNNLEVIGIE